MGVIPVEKRWARLLSSPLFGLGAVFAVSRWLYYLLGIRLQMKPLETFWQYQDSEMLRTRLFESIYYLHIQPPLYNLFIGIVLCFFPHRTEAVFVLLHLLMGLLLALSLYLLLRGFQISTRLSFLLTVCFILSPACILMENWLFYPYPVAVLLCVAALCCQRYYSTGRVRYAAAFLMLNAVTVLTRSLYHPLWFFFTFFMLLLFPTRRGEAFALNESNNASPAVANASPLQAFRGDRRRLILVSILPSVMILGWMVRTFVMFGELGTCTWLGSSLPFVTTCTLPDNEKTELVRQGKLSPLALVRPCGPLELYRPYIQMPEPTGIPVLDEPLKTNGTVNFNHLAYVTIFRQYKEDAIYVASHYPCLYLRTLLSSVKSYLRPASDRVFAASNRSRLYAFFSPFSKVAQIEEDPDEKKKDPGFTLGRFALALGLFLGLLYSFWETFRILVCRTRMPSSGYARFFVATTILYNFVVVNLGNTNENMRCRFDVDPLFVVMGILMLNEVIARIRTRLVAHQSNQGESL